MTPGQAQDARKLLGWSRTQLGVCSSTSVYVVRAFERTGHVANLYGRRTEQVDAIAAMRATLEAAGIEFSNRRMPGVRGRTPSVKLRKHVDCESAEARRVTPYQLKAARALLGWSKMHLALRSATSEHIVATYEKTGQVAGLPDQMDQGDPIVDIRAALEAAGVEFTNRHTPGVRLRKLGQ